MSDADIPAERKGVPRVVWALTPVLAALVYVLGIPPLLHYLGPSLPGKHPLAPYPTWTAKMAEPWMWLQRTSLLNEPLTRYEAWWMNQDPLVTP